MVLFALDWHLAIGYSIHYIITIFDGSVCTEMHVLENFSFNQQT